MRNEIRRKKYLLFIYLFMWNTFVKSGSEKRIQFNFGLNVEEIS